MMSQPTEELIQVLSEYLENKHEIHLIKKRLATSDIPATVEGAIESKQNAQNSYDEIENLKSKLTINIEDAHRILPANQFIMLTIQGRIKYAAVYMREETKKLVITGNESIVRQFQFQ